MKQCIAAALFSLALAGITATTANAGSLTPPGAPAPTMRTMEQLKPSWDQLLSSTDGDTEGCNSSRFKCVMNNVAVLDKETGLVWARSTVVIAKNWQDAMDYCDSKPLGGRFGWRLPTVQELGSLIDGSNPGATKLPVLHPFQNVSNNYWTSSSYASSPTGAWYVSLGVGSVTATGKAATWNIWCVRGGL